MGCTSPTIKRFTEENLWTKWTAKDSDVDQNGIFHLPNWINLHKFSRPCMLRIQYLHSKRMRMGWRWLNRSLRARWSLLSGADQLYLLWASQASLYRRPIHQHPFFLDTTLPLSATLLLFNNNGLMPCSALLCSPLLCSVAKEENHPLCLHRWTFFLPIHTLAGEKENIF